MPKFSSFDLAAATAAQPERQAIELTFAELIDAYAAARPCDTTTRLKKWRDAFGSQGAWSIERDTLVRAAEAMNAAGYSTATVNRDLSAIGSMFRWAHDDRKITPANFRSPTRDIRRTKEAMRVVTMTAAEEVRLRAAALAFRDRRFGLFVALMLDTGARPGELLERSWLELDTQRREIVLPEYAVKTGRARVLHFSEGTAGLILRLLPPQSLRGELVFIGRKGAPTNYRKSWRTLATMIGRPDLRIYDLRHVAAATLLDGGATLAVAAQVLGHSSLILHKRYGHLERAALQRAQQGAWQARDARARKDDHAGANT